MDRPIALRPITEADEDFLYQVYAGTREDELAPLGWTDAELEAFLKMQFAAQSSFYAEQFPCAEFRIILIDEEPAGRLYVDRRRDEIRIIDIALLAEYRNRGFGTSLIGNLLAEGESAGLPVRIHVEGLNPALRLYRRLGFRKIGDNGVYHLMEWSPRPAS